MVKRAKNIFKWLFGHKKVLLITLVVLGIGLFIIKPFGVFGNSGAGNYKVETLKKGNLSTTINVSGTVSAENLATMGFLTSGRVSWLGVKEGDQVSEGEVIASLDTSAVDAGIAKAQANVQSAQAALNKVLDDIHLSQYGNGGFANVGSSNETQTQKTDRQEAEAAVNVANQDLKVAQQQQQIYSIVAPFNGVVSEIKGIASGANITPTSGASITVVGDGGLKFVANVDETEYGELKPGQTGTITLDAFPNETFNGQITKFGVSAVKLATGGSVVPVELSLPDDGRLKNGLNGDVDFNLIAKTDVLVLPRSVVKKDSGSQYVYLLVNNKPVRQNVTTGDSLGTKVEVTSGLKEGDVVILSEVQT